MPSEPNENGQSPPPAQIRQSTEQKPSRKEKINLILRVGLMIFFEIVLPIIIYYVLKKFINDVWAIIISGVPPFILVVYGIIRNRRPDILGLIIIIGFIVSAIVAAVKNDARIQLLRESTVTGSVGLAFLITLIPIKIGSFKMKPLVFYFAKDMATGGSFGYSSSSSKLKGLTEDEPISERWDRYWEASPPFRRGFIILTIVWGVGLILEVPIRAIIVFKAKTIDQAFLLTNIVTYTWLGVLILFNIQYGKHMRRQGEKRAAAAAAAAAFNQNNQNNQNQTL